MTIRQQFADLFGARTINGRTIDVDETIVALVRDLRGDIASALAARRALLERAAPVREKYAWPSWDETFADPVGGASWTFRQIVQGLIDNGSGRSSAWRWRLNEDAPIPKDAHPLDNPGLELTGPWHPLDMAFNALNSTAPMKVPPARAKKPALLAM